LTCERNAIAQPVEERGCDLLRGGGTETDRIGAAGVDCDAVVGDRRRQVEHVAGLEHPLLFGSETSEDLKRQVGLERPITWSANAPTAPARALEEEHIVG